MDATKRKRRGKRELQVKIQRRGGDPSKDQYAETLTRAIVKELFSTRMANTLRLTVKLRATAGFEGKGEHTKGLAQWAEQADPSRKTYTIWLRRDEPHDWHLMLAHELWHVAQFAQGRLRRGSKGGVRGWFWRLDEGRAVFFADGSCPYWDQPWEVEARSKEPVGAKVLNSMVSAKALAAWAAA